jgi:AmmeMemoRadiSam system protein A
MCSSEKSGISLGLTDEEKKYLLRLARETIRAKTEKKEPQVAPPTSKILHEKRGAFVTLHKMGQLRGCIGYIEGIKPLYLTIVDMAEAAAFNDPRFPPVAKQEVEDLDIEISVLTPLEKIDDPQKIEVGKHGILVRKGPFQGLLLPQVATEYGWDRETFLDQTCIKAGMAPGCWKDPATEIYIFSADIFSEKDFAK